MTPTEKVIIVNCLQLIKTELENEDNLNQDTIIVSLIEVILNYCQRFYSRQFATQKFDNNNVLAHFEKVLQDYYESSKQLTEGIPTVKYCSEKLFLSSNYFGDLVKRETGNSPNQFIQNFIINRAKSELIANNSVSDTAYNLGFASQQAFSRFFKSNSAQTPLEYIKSKRV